MNEHLKLQVKASLYIYIYYTIYTYTLMILSPSFCAFTCLINIGFWGDGLVGEAFVLQV